MIRITEINIKRFRSINDITLKISDKENIITICGQNNVGKTNILRALNLFFGKAIFSPKEDIPEFKQMTGGAAVYPLITIYFTETKTDDVFKIEKNFDYKQLEEDCTYDFKLKASKNNVNINDTDAIKVLSNINFFYLPSINISFPETINILIDDKFLDIEFGNARMKGKKAEVKKSLNTAKNTLQEILDDLTSSINPSFKEFHPSWGIKFLVPTKIDRFREVINNEIEFVITDDTQTEIHSKGAGLQRLGHILLNIRIIEKLLSKKKNCLILIDEPDIYLHSKLQKLLCQKIKSLSNNSQVFITTHSPIFINPYRMENLFLLELRVTPTFSSRKSRKGNILETKQIDMNSNDSVPLIKETLGIEDNDVFVVGRKNLLVEGKEDEKYLSELLHVFGLPKVNIIQAGGVTNFIKLLEYYNAICTDFDYKPSFKVLFDNDESGREQSSKIEKKQFTNIDVQLVYIIDAFNTQYTSFKDRKPNIEIEDFIYPEMILDLANKVLKSNGTFKIILEKQFFKQTNNLSMRFNGVLEIIENLKNSRNPDKGLSLSAKGSGFKGGMASKFNLKGDPIKINLINDLDIKYPDVKNFLQNLLS